MANLHLNCSQRSAACCLCISKDSEAEHSYSIAHLLQCLQQPLLPARLLRLLPGFHPPSASALNVAERADPSDLRQIPDNQEVFLSPTSDTSVILEVLGLVEEGAAATDLWEAAK